MTWWRDSVALAVVLLMVAVYGRHLQVTRRRRRRARERAARRLRQQQHDDRQPVVA